jgi:hypothetical protein
MLIGTFDAEIDGPPSLFPVDPVTGNSTNETDNMRPMSDYGPIPELPTS